MFRKILPKTAFSSTRPGQHDPVSTVRVPVMLFVIAALYLASRNYITPTFLDAGFEADLAARVASGEVPYRDFFTLLPPVHFLLTGGAIALFGSSLTVLRWLAAMVGAAVPVLTYLLTIRLLPISTALVVWLMSVVFSLGMTGNLPGYTWTAVMFGLGSVLSLLVALDRQDLRMAFLAGTLLGPRRVDQTDNRPLPRPRVLGNFHHLPPTASASSSTYKWSGRCLDRPCGILDQSRRLV